GLRAAKPAFGSGGAAAAITAFADAAGTTHEVAEKVLGPLERSVQQDPKSAQKKPGTPKRTSQGSAPVFDRAAVERFATLLGVSPKAAGRALHRLTDASKGRVDTESTLFTQVAADLGVSRQRLEDASRGLKTWMLKRDGGARADDKRNGGCKKPDRVTSDS